MSLINLVLPDTGNFLVDIILWLVNITSSVAAGVILFTVLLKLITLPFDFMSRFSMRKNSIKMEEMRPELEKLQQQYADNKDLYNQKMMALYKKNGYSMFGACLPTILTLIIFIVAVTAFNDYSKYQNVKYFYDMTNAYNGVLYAGLDTDERYIIVNGENLIVDMEGISEIYSSEDAESVSDTVKKFTPEGENHEIFIEKSSNEYVIYTTNSYVYYVRGYSSAENGETFGNISFRVREEGLTAENNPLASEANDYLKIKTAEGELTYSKAAEGENPMTAENFILDIRQERSAETFRNNGSKFLWVKNIWVTDSALAHPIESYQDFNNKHGQREGGSCSCSGTVTPVMSEGDYNNLTEKLSEQKSQPNGYFILVALTAGISLLTQIVMSKSQKAQMELQTVDGQGAQTQKIMTWMMPIMMAVFAFMYTAAFSLYIILSSLISMFTTIGINKIADLKYKKKTDEGGVTHSRVYTPKQQPEEDKKGKKDKKGKIGKKEENEGDFLSGEADKKKHIRGRLK